MADKSNETLDMEGPGETGGDNPLGMLALALGGGSQNPKPDTAQGVADILHRVSEMVEERQRAQLSELHAPDGTSIPIMLTPDGRVDFLDLKKLDDYAENPTYRRGMARMTSLDSFIAHVNRFGDADSAVFACDDREAPAVTALLDYHRADILVSEGEGEGDRAHGEYRHGKHRTTFAFPLSDEWKTWIGQDGVKMSMVDFALFLEDHMDDIAFIDDDVPESAARFVEANGGSSMIADWQTLNTLARGLRIDESATVEQAVNLSNGEGKITLASELNPQVNGVSFMVPTMFFIAIPVFRNGAFYRLPVRLRYRKTREGVTFWFDLWRQDRAFDNAFREAVERVDAETEAQVFFGSPE